MYVLITGGFDPIHSGHIAAFNKAASLGKLIVGLNSDVWLTRKKGAFFLPYSERRTIIRSLSMVYYVLDSWNDDDGTACQAISKFYKEYGNRNEPLAFVNGGDRTPSGASEAEFDLCTSLGIVSVFGVGGGKTASSSTFLGDYVEAMSKK
jgi:D-beta-D-heptose 7-phosphate kinase/D-beta-D-heptose 1-phosphate adenosyltransferase